MKINKVSELLKEGKPLFSFEYFPPKTAKGWEGLLRTIADEMIPLQPAYVSVTYGAGGSTRANTHKLVTKIQQDFGLTVVAHLTCVGSTKDEVDQILDSYNRAGVHNILALRGDLPKIEGPQGTVQSRKEEPEIEDSTSSPGRKGSDDLENRGTEDLNNKLESRIISSDSINRSLSPSASGSYFEHAADLVAYIRKKQPHFSIGVAGFPEGHPDTQNRFKEIEYTKVKVDAGADYIVTQLFFDNRDYFDYVARLQIIGVKVPVIPGIMPISSRKGMIRMADLAAGARFPAPLLKALARAQDDEGVELVGIHWATAQIADLLNGDVPGIHLYTLNHSKATLQICKNMGFHTF